MLVPVFVTVTLTPGIAAPVASRTVPKMVPRNDCAPRVPLKSTIAMSRSAGFTKCFIFSSHPQKKKKSSVSHGRQTEDHVVFRPIPLRSPWQKWKFGTEPKFTVSQAVVANASEFRFRPEFPLLPRAVSVGPTHALCIAELIRENGR